MADRKKSEPLQEISQDHLVRKIFSKFRKNGSETINRPGSSNQVAALPSPDLEKGEGPTSSQMDLNSENSRKTGRETNSSEGTELKNGSGRNSSRWSLIVDETSLENKENQYFNEGGNKLDNKKAIGAIPPIKGKGSKWAKLMDKSESGDVENEDTKSDKDLAIFSLQKQMSQQEQSADSVQTCDFLHHRNSSDYQQIVANLMDLRIDLKLEIQRLNNKITRIDDHIGELIHHVPRFESNTLVLRNVGDHTRHTCSKSGSKKEGCERGTHGGSKKKGKTKNKGPVSQSSPTDMRAMLENEIEELDRDSTNKELYEQEKDPQ